MVNTPEKTLSFRRSPFWLHYLIVVLVLWGCASRKESPDIPDEPSDRDGLGTAIIIPDTPVHVGQQGTWRFLITVGEGGIPEGGGIVLQVSPWWGWSPPQSEIPSAPGFCSVKTTARECEIESGGDYSRYYLLVTVTAGRLEQGDTVTIVYGDTQDGGNPTGAAVADRYAERFQEFVIKTDGDSDGVFGEIEEQPGLRILPLDASELWVNAPSLVRPGEVFDVSVSALDIAGNIAYDYAGTLHVHASQGLSVPSRLVLDSRHGGARRFRAVCERSGIHSIRVHDSRNGFRAESNPFLCGDGTVFKRVYWGDIHGHTALSDGTGDPTDYYRYARDAAGLDVAAITDHAALGFRPLRGKPWNILKDAAEEYNEPGRFVTLLGYEWTSWIYGHRNVYYAGLEGEPISPYDSGAESPAGLFALLDKWDPVTIPHHVAGGPIAMDWSNTPHHRFERLIEVFSVHGNCEYEGCPGMIYHAESGHFVQDALADGRKLGLLASGDGHIGHPGRWIPSYKQGLVAFWADELSREALWESLRGRRVYGTSGARILLHFTVNGHPVGSDIPWGEMVAPRRCTVNVFGTEVVEVVELLKNNTVIAELYGNGLLETLQFEDTDPPRDGDYYYVRITQRDGHQAWAGPIWFGEE